MMLAKHMGGAEIVVRGQTSKIESFIQSLTTKDLLFATIDSLTTIVCSSNFEYAKNVDLIEVAAEIESSLYEIQA